MDRFVAWNLRLLQHCFSTAFSDEETWLTASAADLDAIGSDLNGAAGLLDAVRVGPPWCTIRGTSAFVRRGDTKDLVARSRGLYEQRRRPLDRPADYVDPGTLADEYRGIHAPTYLPILAALVWASAEMDAGGFYAKLGRALQLDARFGTGQLTKLEALWEDLSTWTTTTSSCFGIFRFRRLGGFDRIGVPRSQSIMVSRDGESLTRVFVQAGVSPGEKPTSQKVNDVCDLARTASVPLSRAFRLALSDESLSDPVREMVIALMEEWDGVVAGHRAGARDAAGAGSTLESRRCGEVQVALQLHTGNRLPWRVSWRVEPPSDHGQGVLTTLERSWPVRYGATEWAISGAVSDATDVLAAAADNDVPFKLDSESSDGDVRELIFRSRRMWTLVGEEVDLANGETGLALVERDLPATGNAYILSSPTGAPSLRDWISRQRLRSSSCPTDGLPPGWVLVMIDDCALLTEEARRTIPDGDGPDRSRPRTLRLVGGLRLLRGGVRQFFPYDLPLLELDAPTQVTVQASSGLMLAELVPLPRGVGLIGSASGIRRYRLEIRDTQVRSFAIVARERSRDLDSIRLRLAPIDGVAWSNGQRVYVDRQGIVRGGVDGLTGVMLSSGTSVITPNRLSVSLEGFETASAEGLAESAAARFADALTQRGHLTYGAARDALTRQLVDTGAAFNAIDVLRGLRALGALEIESDSKGRWIRVHPTPPALFTLPVLPTGGGVVASLSGTLLGAQLRKLARVQRDGVRVVMAPEVGAVVSGLCLHADNVSQLANAAGNLGVKFAVDPASQIASWSASLDEVCASITAGGVESLGISAISSSEFFQPPTGIFRRRPLAAASEGEALHLVRVEDSETERHKIFSLSYRNENGDVRYGFVRDSRWGVWASLRSFSQFARDAWGNAEACPWPIEYSATSGELWIPGRISLPMLLERSLVLCSGSLPRAMRSSRALGFESLVLEATGAGRRIGQVSKVYDGFLPEPPDSSVWIGYKWIPQDIATTVASRLHAQLRPISD